MKPKQVKMSQLIGQSRVLAFLALYMPMQILTLCVGLLVHLAIPSSVWCEVELPQSTMLAFNARAVCGIEQLSFIIYLAVAGSVLFGVYGFLFPQRIARGYRQAEAEQ